MANERVGAKVVGAAHTHLYMCLCNQNENERRDTRHSTQYADFASHNLITRKGHVPEMLISSQQDA